MPTPSELQNERPRRSVFGNYPTPSGDAALSAPSDSRQTLSRLDNVEPKPLQASIDSAVARLFIYQFLARAFEDAAPETWEWLSSPEALNALRLASAALDPARLAPAADRLAQRLASSQYVDFADEHIRCFGHTVRGECPMNEIEYGDIKADPLFQPHRLSDLAAFFAAFGLEITPDAAERIDHISIELEFMSVLAAKEAFALESQAGAEELALLRDAQKKFLREHLGRWCPAFARRLSRQAQDTPLGGFALVLAEFVTLDCLQFGLQAGSEDLLLRPVDDATERLCDSCGIHGLPPGAVAAGAQL